MFVELIESLRCPAAHEPTVLVAAASRAAHRHILDGVLGCPQCGAEYHINDGIARFGAAPAVRSEEPSMEVAMRIAAFLELTDASGFAVLSGRWCAHASAVAQLTETPLVLVNPPEDAVLERAAAVLETGGVLPFAEGTARGLALDADALAVDAVGVVRSGGRVIAPGGVAIPSTLREIARDDAQWVAERVGAPPQLISLRRAP